MRSRKEKLINYMQFQNTVEIFVRIPASDSNSDISNISMKLFANGSFTLTGCSNVKMPELVAEMTRVKVNDTPGATSKSELSDILQRDIKLDHTFSNRIRFTMINASSKCNVMLVPTVGDPYGLVKLQGMFLEKFSDILVDETDPKIKSHQTPCRIPPMGVKSSKRLIIKLKGVDNNSVTTVQWHSTGAMNFTSTSEDDLMQAYSTIHDIITDAAHVSTTTRQIQ